MEKIIKVLLVFWTVIGVFFAAGSVYLFFAGYTYDAYTWLALAAISVIMYWMNTKRRKLYSGTSKTSAPEEKEKEKK